jgi:hypothetical protein
MKKYFIATFIIIFIFLVLGINKVAYLFSNTVQINYPLPFSVEILSGKIQVHIFEMSLGIDYSYLAELSKEKILEK